MNTRSPTPLEYTVCLPKNEEGPKELVPAKYHSELLLIWRELLGQGWKLKGAGVVGEQAHIVQPYSIQRSANILSSPARFGLQTFSLQTSSIFPRPSALCPALLVHAYTTKRTKSRRGRAAFTSSSLDNTKT